MSFYKTAKIQPLGYFERNTWKRTAQQRTASRFMEGGFLDVERALDVVAETYNISRNPDDYLLVPARAVSADRFNSNRDGFRFEELTRFDEDITRKVYQSFDLKPHFVNHQATNPKVSRGCVLDVHLNTLNSADDTIKQAVFADTGKSVQTDDFVELLIAVDTTKDPALASAYKSGSVNTFSMGADVASTTCGVCGNTAYTAAQFCEHVNSKFSGRRYDLGEGRSVEAGEWCNGTRYAEISAVDDPADKSAEVQEGLLSVSARTANFKTVAGLSDLELSEIVSFTIKHARVMPASLLKLVNVHLASR